MDMSDLTTKALENAYMADVVTLYSVLADAIAIAADNQNEIDAAKERFAKGLEAARRAYKEALVTVGL